MSLKCVSTFSVSDDFNHDKVVCPPSLKAGAFTTAAIDYVDQNRSSNKEQLCHFFSILL